MEPKNTIMEQFIRILNPATLKQKQAAFNKAWETSDEAATLLFQLP
jgi:hypothetical protein